MTIDHIIKEPVFHVSIIWILQCNSKATPVEFWTERWGIRQRVRWRLRCEGEWSYSQFLKTLSMFLTWSFSRWGVAPKWGAMEAFEEEKVPTRAGLIGRLLLLMLLWIRAGLKLFGQCPYKNDTLLKGASLSRWGQNLEPDLRDSDVCQKCASTIECTEDGTQCPQCSGTGVNKKPKKFKTFWHGVRGILKLSGRVNQASLKLSAGFSNTVCWTS